MTLHATLTQIRELADSALLEVSEDITIRLSDGTAAFGEFDELKPEVKRGNHGFRGPGVPAGLTTIEPIGEHVGEVQPHYHWQIGSTLFGQNITTQKLKAHGRTTDSLGAHNLSLMYQSAILDAGTNELLIPDQIIIYYKDWDKEERPEPIGENYRPMVRARYKQTNGGQHHFSLIFPNDDDHNIVNPELKFVYNAPNGWKCQTNGKTGADAMVHGGYVPAHSSAFTDYLIQIATMPASGRAQNRGKALPERFKVDGVEMFKNARTPLQENWPEIPKL